MSRTVANRRDHVASIESGGVEIRRFEALPVDMDYPGSHNSVIFGGGVSLLLGGTSALGLSYADGPLASVSDAVSDAALAVAVGERVAQVTAPQEAASAGWRSLLAELGEPGWSLLSFARAGDGATLRRLARLYEGTVRVRTVPAPGAQGTDAAVPGPLPDPDGLLANGLAARPGSWLLIRPDGYLAAAGRLDTADPADAAASLGLRSRPDRARTHR